MGKDIAYFKPDNFTEIFMVGMLPPHKYNAYLTKIWHRITSSQVEESLAYSAGGISGYRLDKHIMLHIARYLNDQDPKFIKQCLQRCREDLVRLVNEEAERNRATKAGEELNLSYYNVYKAFSGLDIEKLQFIVTERYDPLQHLLSINIDHTVFGLPGFIYNTILQMIKINGIMNSYREYARHHLEQFKAEADKHMKEFANTIVQTDGAED